MIPDFDPFSYLFLPLILLSSIFALLLTFVLWQNFRHQAYQRHTISILQECNDRLNERLTRHTERLDRHTHDSDLEIRLLKRDNNWNDEILQLHARYIHLLRRKLRELLPVPLLDRDRELDTDYEIDSIPSLAPSTPPPPSPTPEQQQQQQQHLQPSVLLNQVRDEVYDDEDIHNVSASEEDL